MSAPARRGALLVLAGPSGVGKGTVVAGLRERFPDLVWSVSWATRAPRPGEVDGRDYHFVTRAQFDEERARGGFLESFEVYGDGKGTPRRPVEEALAAGSDVLLEVDVQGALAVRETMPEAVLVFLRAPSSEEQRARLRHRAGSDPHQLEALDRRLAAAAEEEARAPDFDAVVVNRSPGQAVDEVAAILERHRAAR